VQSAGAKVRSELASTRVPVKAHSCEQFKRVNNALLIVLGQIKDFSIDD
jgi:hypothetical protein